MDCVVCGGRAGDKRKRILRALTEVSREGGSIKGLLYLMEYDHEIR